MADIYPGEYNPSMAGVAVSEGRLFFYANSGRLGGELNTFHDAPSIFLKCPGLRTHMALAPARRGAVPCGAGSLAENIRPVR